MTEQFFKASRNLEMDRFRKLKNLRTWELIQVLFFVITVLCAKIQRIKAFEQNVCVSVLDDKSS